MNPILILLIMIGAVVSWFLLSGFYRLIGGFTKHFIDNAKSAIEDQPTNVDAFVDGFKDGVKKEKKDE